MAAISKGRWDWLLLLAWGLFVHGLLLLNDGVYWDGWVYVPASMARDWSLLGPECVSAGFPLIEYMHRLPMAFSSVAFGYRVTEFAALLLISAGVWRLCRRMGVLGRGEAVAVAAIALASPVFSVVVSQVFLHSLLNITAFIWALVLVECAESATGTRHLLFRLAGLLLFPVGFMFDGLLPMYYGCMLLILLAVAARQGLRFFPAMAKYLPRRLDYLLLPVVYWVLRNRLFPQRGIYAGEYGVLSSPGLLLYVSRMLLRGLWSLLKDSLEQCILHPLVCLMLILACGAVAAVLWRRDESWGEVRCGARAVLAAGVGLLLLAVLPFALLGKAPDADAWGLRHLILVPVPLAVCSLGIARLAGKDASGRVAKFSWILLLVVLAGSAMGLGRGYLAWQARWAKDRAVVLQLSRYAAPPPGTVYQIDDNTPAARLAYYRFYEWAGLLGQAWGGQRWAARDMCGKENAETLKEPHFVSRLYNLGDFPSGGPLAEMHIRWARPDLTDDGVALRYLYYRFLDRQKMQPFLSGLVTVDREEVGDVLPSKS